MTMGDTVGTHTNPGETSMREAARVLSFLPTSHCLFCLCFSDHFAKIPKLPEKNSHKLLYGRGRNVCVCLSICPSSLSQF